MLAISSHPLPTLQGFLASRRDELLRANIPSLLKALELLRWAGAEGQHDAVCDLLDEMPLQGFGKAGNYPGVSRML